jgi:intracellular septation protein A
VPAPTLGSLFLGSGPRFARDAVGPTLVFYAGWKLAGLGVGVAVATIFTVGAYIWEKRRGRTGLGARIGLAIALVQAAAGLLTGTAVGYFLPPVVINGVYGLAFVISVVIGRPLAGVFASETYPFPPEVKASVTFRRTFSRVSLVWGAYLFARSALRLLVLTRMSVETFVVVNIVTGLPFTAALMSWSLWYGLRSFRRSDEWGARDAGAAP